MHFSHLVLGYIPFPYPLSFLRLGTTLKKLTEITCMVISCVAGSCALAMESCFPRLTHASLLWVGVCSLRVPRDVLQRQESTRFHLYGSWGRIWCTFSCSISLRCLWLSGLPSAFGSQSEKEQATLETFCYEKEFDTEELMRTVEKEYCGVLGTAPILSCRRGGIMDWMWNQVICIWIGFSLVAVDRGLFFPKVGGMKINNLCMVQIMGGRVY